VVLLAEDEPALAHVLERIFVAAGLRVVACANGMVALDILSSDVSPVDVLVSDVKLPGLTGDLLAREAGLRRPELPVVLMTGFSEMVTPENADLLGAFAILQKPVTARRLVSTVQEALLAAGRRPDR
jgi:DNA-binding NtrC family response regulator